MPGLQAIRHYDFMWKSPRPAPSFLEGFPVEPVWPRSRRVGATALGAGLLLGAFHLAGPSSPTAGLILAALPAVLVDLAWSVRADLARRRRLGAAVALPRPPDPGVWPLADLAGSAHARLRLAEADLPPDWSLGQTATHVFLLAPEKGRWRTLLRCRR